MKTIKRATILCIFIARLTATPLLCQQPQPVSKSPASAIEVQMIQPGEIHLPAEFQVALYENLVQELQKKGDFLQVYREGDRNAAGASNLVTLQTTVTGFKKGSELERDVTTVGGATSITIHCKFTDKEGNVLLERDITGKVKLIGDNLKATDDFAKKAATAAQETLAPDSTSSNPKKSAYKNVI
ncbi:MAG TPA: hypothetical protein VMI10_08950 [Terriglobales bacterium]|nr:hypothetical protein [Terriglobales bacterium]